MICLYKKISIRLFDFTTKHEILFKMLVEVRWLSVKILWRYMSLYYRWSYQYKSLLMKLKVAFLLFLDLAVPWFTICVLNLFFFSLRENPRQDRAVTSAIFVTTISLISFTIICFVEVCTIDRCFFSPFEVDLIVFLSLYC